MVGSPDAHFCCITHKGPGREELQAWGSLEDHMKSKVGDIYHTMTTIWCVDHKPFQVLKE